MAEKRVGTQTIALKNPVSIVAASTIAGPKEGQGPLRTYFDSIIEDELFGEKSWEMAESKLMRENIIQLLNKASKKADEVNYILAGDLLNQCTASSYGLREISIPFLGLYGACSTMAETMSVGAMLIDGGFADNLICMTSSHFCSAEKQFRYPLELGTQRSPTAQWTVTGCGGVMLSSSGLGPYITHVTTGKIVDMGIKDANNMGAAMAPAAVDTIYTHFKDTSFGPEMYDLILTGDLGRYGREIVGELLLEQKYNVISQLNDCGLMVFDNERQDTHAGGSGCGCAALVFSGLIHKKLQQGELKNVLLVATGALHSPGSIQQGESIPGIAHAVKISKDR